jgi:hypothetical protein
MQAGLRRLAVCLASAALLVPAGVLATGDWDRITILTLTEPSPGVLVTGTRDGITLAPLGLLEGDAGAEHNNQYEAASCSDPYLLNYFDTADPVFNGPPYNVEPGGGTPCANRPGTNMGPPCNPGDPLISGYTSHVHGIDGYRFWTVTAGPFGVGWAWACHPSTGSMVQINCVPQNGFASVQNGQQFPSWQCAVMQKGPTPLWAYGTAGPWQGGGCNCQNAYQSRTTAIFDS